MPKNPFEIFGLSPELVGNLSEKELFSVLKSMYRALQKTVHPDLVRRGTKPGPDGGDKAVELNLAFEALNLDKNPQSFRRHRKTFVARRPKSVYQKSLLLQRELQLQAAREERLAEAYFSRLLADSGWREPPPPFVLPFPLQNVRLGLLDVAINQNLKMASWSLGSNYKEMKFDAKGQLSLKPVGRGRFSRAAYIQILGSVPADRIELMPLLERPPARFFKAPALNAGIGADGPSLSVLNRISQANFKRHILAHLRPQVTERAYIFSINRPDFEEDGSITLEGLIVKIDQS